MQDTRDIAVLIAARTPLIVLETRDEKGAMELLQRVAREQDRSLSRWTVTDGLLSARFGLQVADAGEHHEPDAVLRYLKEHARPGIYVLCDLHPWLADHPRNTRLLKDIVLRNEHGPVTLVLVSHVLELPRELSRYAVRVSVALPSEGEILSLVKEEARLYASRNQGTKVRADSASVVQLAKSLRGLSRNEVKRLARTAIVDDGAITEADIPTVTEAKFRLMDMEGVLSFIYDTEDFSSLGGMDNLRQWLDLRTAVFSGEQRDPAVDVPRGVMLLGVQGGGKSLAARAVAGHWEVAMLRLDMGALYNKYHGETERNLRESLQLAERMAPCVLWIDEIEKGIAGHDGDGGVSRRVLGTLLTWMQERSGRVFLVATANDIQRLPPELLRKGRFDEIFFADLPDAGARETIFAIHLDKRGCDPAAHDLAQLAAASEGFSGAEIEQALVSALYNAGSDALDDERIRQALRDTAPLSLVMAERLEGLRQWARERNIKPVQAQSSPG